MALRKENILLVDDDINILELLQRHLHTMQYHTYKAISVKEALHILKDTNIDLLITDVGLPGGMNGRQVADAARVGRPALKVLFITGYAENAVIGKGRLEQGMFVITKPFQMDALARRIREIIES